MKLISLLLLLGLGLLSVIGIQAQTSIGGFNVYYVYLHNHTSVSDGTGTPAQAYTYARDVAHLDFFGLAEHANMMTSTEWTTVKNAADSYRQLQYWEPLSRQSSQFGYLGSYLFSLPMACSRNCFAEASSIGTIL